MNKAVHVGFVGMGKMGSALAARAQADIVFTDIRPDVTVTIGDKTVTAVPISTLLGESDVVIFAVKPQQIQAVLDTIWHQDISRVKLWISILAGVPLAKFQAILGADVPMVRAMPNTPAMVGQGMTALAFATAVTPHWREWATGFFSGVGKVVTVDEKDLNAVTALSGSGPAFFYKMADAMAKAGQTLGLSYDQSLALVSQTLVGAGEMLQHFGDPTQLAENVTSPGGTTAAGLAQYDRVDLARQLQSIVKVTYERAVALEKEV
ncbi:MAG: pyrroline-5-carboxylate reductase [Candidatus Margulisiibacteriota bacterium]